MIRKHPYLFLLPFFALACAKQTAPTGGPKDTIPPVVVYSMPNKGAINFKQQRIEITFDESVTLNNPKEQIIITPDVGKDYVAVARKKTVEIRFEKPLQDSTTYTINFRDAVQDITEKNEAVNLKLAFSTGHYIDSLKLQGTISHLLTDKPIKDATVALYETDTFNIFKHRPTYITKTDKDGNFILENIKSDTFYLYAFEDKNRNLIADSRTENFGFDATPIDLANQKDPIPLKLIRLDSRPIKISSARPYNTYYNARFTKGINNYTLTSTTEDTIYSTLTTDYSNIKIYNKNITGDSTAVRLSARDSLGQSLDTTVFVKFLEKPPTKEKFQFTFSEPVTSTRQNLITLTANYNKPIHVINTDSIQIQIDSITTIQISNTNVELNNQTGQLQIKTPLDKTQITQLTAAKNSKSKPNNSDIPYPRIYISEGSFVSIESDSSTQFVRQLKPLTQETTSTLIVHIESTKPAYIVEVLNKNFEIIKSTKNTSKNIFHEMPPSDYQIRVIEDTNNDGKWSPGNFYTKTPPEKVHYYKNDKQSPIVSLKANWEVGPLLIKF